MKSIIAGKHCTKCKTWKEFSEFATDKSTKDGYTSSCKSCRKDNTKRWRLNNPEKERESHKASNLKWRTKNPEKHRQNVLVWMADNVEKAREHRRKSSKTWRLKNPEKAKDNQAKWRSENPEKAKTATKRWITNNADKIHGSDLKRKYGIGQEDYDRMFREQNGLCKVCGRDNNGKRLCVDHDHKTRRVRGLLCTSCNAAIGSFGDELSLLEKAILYLRGGK